MATDTDETVLTTSYQLIVASPALITLETGKLAMIHLTTGGAPAADAPAHRLISQTDKSWLTWSLAGHDIYAKKSAAAEDKEVVISHTGG